MFTYKPYLKDIIEAIKRIEKSTKNKTITSIKNNDEIWDATLMRLQVIGESIKRLPPKIKGKYSGVEWNNFEKFRDIISHKYLKVNPLIVQTIIKEKIPKLKKEVNKILKNET